MKDNKFVLTTIPIAIIFFIMLGLLINNIQDKAKISKIDNMVSGTWQAEVQFPDWNGYIDDTLALNSMYSFDGVKDQGKLYFTINEKVESFDLFINNNKIDTIDMKNGIYEIDISKIAVNGTNTIQVSNISPNDIEEAIKVNIPYQAVIDGTLEEVRTTKRTI